MTGTIKKIIADKGFGFITVDGAGAGDKDLFFHSKAVSGQFTDFAEGDKVSFDKDDSGPKGPAAINVAKA